MRVGAVVAIVGSLTLAPPLMAQEAGPQTGAGVDQQILPGIDGTALGLLPSRATGLPTDLWSSSTSSRVVHDIRAVKGTGTPSPRLVRASVAGRGDPA